MKILQVIPQLCSGGAERFVVDLCNELSALGHEVVLCTLMKLEGDRAFYKSELSPDVRCVTLNKKLGFSFKTMFDFYALVKNEKPDIIHSHLKSLPYTFLAVSFLCKGIHTIHNDAKREAGDVVNRMTRKYLFRIGRVVPVTISPESDRSFRHYYKLEPQLINNGRNIPNDIIVSSEVKNEIESYKVHPQTRCIVQLARLEPQKNIPMMSRVAKRLEQKGYCFVILNIGMSKNKTIVDQIKTIGSESQHLLGERKNPLEYLKYAGAFSLSSIHEGMPISLIEALGVGAIPICTPVGGIVDIIQDGKNGFLAANIQEESFYNALKRYLDTPDDKLAEIRKNALLSYKPFSMTECAKKYVDLYKTYKSN